RSLGFLFAILALHQLYLFYRGGRAGHAAAGGVFAGLTALSHLGTAPFVAFSAALFWLACDRSRRGLLGSLAAAGLALLLAAPWLVTVLHRFGPEPFLASGATGSSVFSGYESRHAVFWALSRLGVWTGGEQLFPVVAPLAIRGGLRDPAGGDARGRGRLRGAPPAPPRRPAGPPGLRRGGARLPPRLHRGRRAAPGPRLRGRAGARRPGAGRPRGHAVGRLPHAAREPVP